jgi:hypothetical protein
MTAAPSSPGGRQLWALLPEHYRSRDNGDLASYVDALGEVVDLLRGVIQQRLADSFPDHPDLQPWVLPYLADLIDPRVVSADETRRRAEIANAALWRKTKGTLRMVEQIAAALGGFGWSDGDPAARPSEPVRVDEGLRRVAVTPRVPLDTPPEIIANRKQLLAHASLPMGTVDLRFYSRRIASGEGRAPVQANPHGVPCFPGSVEDLAARTPDLRMASWRSGFAHPSRVLIFTVPHAGFFPPGWELGPAPVEDDTSARGGVLGTGRIEQAPDALYTVEDCIIDGTLTVKAGAVRLVRCAVKSLVVETPIAVDAARRPTGKPVVVATDCLFESIQSAGLAQLTHCTVLGNFVAPRAWVSDSLFAGSFDVPKSAEPWHKNAQGDYDGTPTNALRYSRVPPSTLVAQQIPASRGQSARRLDFQPYRCTGRAPFFAASQFGVGGCGVLLPSSGPEIEAGAEDGGELGAYHHRGHAVRARAVLEKLRDYLPVGQVAVIIPDPKLGFAPPTLERSA